MRTVGFDLISALLVSILVFFVGRFLVARVSFLGRLNIPAPVVGGGLVAILLAVADGILRGRLGFDLGPKDTLLLIFFTTIGLAAAHGAKISKRSGLRGITVPVHPAAGPYFGPAAPGATPKG